MMAACSFGEVELAIARGPLLAQRAAMMAPSWCAK